MQPHLARLLRVGTDRRAVHGLAVPLCLAFALLALARSHAQAPDWWQEHGVLDPAATADDYAAVNQGQLKHVATQALAELDTRLPGGAGSTLSAFIGAWRTEGLRGEYFANRTLSGLPVLVRHEAVDFDWGVGSPDALVPVNLFSVRWTGELIPALSGEHMFETVSDDGVRLWVDNALVIDNWTEHAPTSDFSAPIALVAGQSYPVRLEYYENGGGATVRLRWRPPGASDPEAIPVSRLRSSSAGLAADDYAAVNLGQLKHVAKPFYDRLHELGYTGQPLAAGQTYPWDSSPGPADDYALANIGQVKNVFSFDVSDISSFYNPYAPWGIDSDGDGIPDWWELLYGFNPFDASDGAAQLASYQHQVLNRGKAPETANALGLLVYTP